jgi:hypothetical protein
MSRVRQSLLLLILLLVLAGTVHSADDKMPTTPYFPLAVGSTWTSRAGEARYLVKVTKHEKVGSLLCARLEMFNNNKSTYHEHVVVSSSAVSRAGSDGKTITPPLPFLKLPPKKDATWNVDSKVDGQSFKGIFKAGESDSVKVPAGTYKAVTVTGQDVEVDGVKFNVTYYYAEKVGMIRQVIEIAGQKIEIVLEKFEPGKE